MRAWILKQERGSSYSELVALYKTPWRERCEPGASTTWQLKGDLVAEDGDDVREGKRKLLLAEASDSRRSPLTLPSSSHRSTGNRHAFLQDIHRASPRSSSRAHPVRRPVSSAQEDHQPNRRRAFFPRYAPSILLPLPRPTPLPGLSPDVLQAVIDHPPVQDGKGKRKEDGTSAVSGPRVVYELATAQDGLQPRLHLYLHPEDASQTPPSQPTITIPLSASSRVFRLSGATTDGELASSSDALLGNP